MFSGYGDSALGIREEEKTHLSIVSRHANFVNVFDAGLPLSVKQHSHFVPKMKRVRTFELPSDFYHVWEWHAGGKIEADEFDDEPLDGQQPLSVLFDDLVLTVP
jgi:hypothetical protein